VLVTIGAGAFLFHGWSMGDPMEMGIAGGMLCLAIWLCFQLTKTTFALALLAAGGLGGGFYYFRVQEANAFRPIANVASKAAMAHPNFQNTISLTGRVVVWDMHGDCLSPAYYKLPYALRAKPDDQAMTVFLIWNVRSQFLWRYRNTSKSPMFKVDAPAYRDTADFAVLRWPERELISWKSLAGAVPEKHMTFHASEASKEVHGDWVGTFAQWVLTVPGGMDAETMPRPQWTPATAQAEAMRRYPDLGIAGSPLNRAFLEKYQSLKAGNSPDLQDPAWPLHLTRKIAN